MEILYYSLAFGVIAGLGYTLLKNIAILLNSNKIAYIICDIVSMLLAGFLFCYTIIAYNNGIIRLYIICAFVLGFLIELISVGNLLDFCFGFVYNKVKLALYNVKNKVKSRRKQNGAKEIKQPN